MEVTTYGPIWSTIRDGAWEVTLVDRAAYGTCCVEVYTNGDLAAVMVPDEDPTSQLVYRNKARSIPKKVELAAVALVLGYRMAKGF